MIAYNFPPIGGSGTIRNAKFAKYLPEFGWQPYVLTGPNGAGRFQDPGMLKELSADVVIHRAWCLSPAAIEGALFRWWQILWKLRFRNLAQRMQPFQMMRWLAIPDATFSWIGPGYRKARKIIIDSGIDVIFSSALPPSAHLIASRLSQRFGIPWVADYRDQWTQNPLQGYVSHWHRRFNLNLELDALRSADRVVATTQEIADGLRSLVPEENASKFICISNGFDPADLEGLGTGVAEPNGQFKVAHIGNLYASRTPRDLLKAIDSLIGEGEVSDEEIQMLFLGNAEHPDISPYLDRKWLVRRPAVSHSQALREMREQDALVLLVHNEAFDTVPAKVFEYIAVGRPVIAIGPAKSPVERLINETQCGVFVKNGDIEAIHRAVLNAYQAWKSDSWNLASDTSTIARYDRRELTARLASIFDELLQAPLI